MCKLINNRHLRKAARLFTVTLHLPQNRAKDL